MKELIEQLERQLDSFNPHQRKEAFHSLIESVRRGDIVLPEHGSFVNMHCHSFFSYNAYGYSPSKFAWLGCKAGLAVVGVVDFDVLDGLDEFLEAGRMLNLKTCVGLETRVFVPEFAEKEISSPGEKGIAYNMAVGFPCRSLHDEAENFLKSLKQTAQDRNRELMERVNRYLSPVELDYEKDVLPLTPADNATERHLCLSYARKAHEILGSDNELARFWADKLSTTEDKILPLLSEGIELMKLIRAKTMKRGGVGYVPPDKGSFPLLEKTNEFALAAGAIPTFTWLDGTSEGEKEIEKLIEIAQKSGSAALNIIPDRNYTPNVKEEKVANLYNVVELAEKLQMPIVVGTEMNAPGQKFVDNFKSTELSPLVPVFLKGAHIVYAHSVLQKRCGMGYTSSWAGKTFSDKAEKNKFFEQVGSRLQPVNEDCLEKFDENTAPNEILKMIR